MKLLQTMFSAVVTMTPWAALLIVLLMTLRRWGGKRLSARFFQLAFIILALRLALPVDLSLPDAPIHLGLPIALAPQIEFVTASDPQTKEQTSSAVSSEKNQQKEPLIPAAVQQPRRFVWGQVLVGVWFFGAAGFLLFRLMGYISFCVEITAARKNVEPEIWRQAQEIFGAPTAVYTAPQITSPMLVGLARPAVYLPPQLDEENLPYILAHEACHAKRKDVAMQYLLMVVQSLHWFNPLVHWMAHIARQDMERSCDAKVLQNHDMSYRQAYGRAVLNSLAAIRQRQAMMLSTGFSSGEDTKRRFKEMFQMDEKKNGRPLLVIVAAGVLAASMLVACKVSANTPNPSSESAMSSTSQVPQPESSSLATSTPEDSQTASESTAESAVPSGSADAAQPEDESAGLIQKPEKESADSADTALQQDEKNQLLAADTALKWPVPGFTWISRGMGPAHKAIDIVAPHRSDILACADGTVTEAGFEHSMGIYVVIDHGEGLKTLYSHCHELCVIQGEQVTQGQKIALVGNTGDSTGNHLHLEVHQNDQMVDPAPLLGVQDLNVAQ